MSYPTNMPGIQEARLDAIKTLIVNSLTDLNTRLTSISPAVNMPTWNSSMVIIGDPQDLTHSRISIVGGGEQDGTDMTTEFYDLPLTDTSGVKHLISTNIYLYLHPDDFGQSATEETFERARARISDHIRRGVFNDPANFAITLGSRELRGVGEYDQLAPCQIREVAMGMVPKAMGGMEYIRTCHWVHVAEIA